MQNLFVRYRICLSYAERFSVSGSQRSFSISRTSDWPFGMDRRSFLLIVPDRTIV